MIKKILSSLLVISSFFILPNVVNAEPLDGLRETYTGYVMTSCHDSSPDKNSICSVIDTEENPITNYTFRNVLDLLELNFNYYFIFNQYSNMHSEDNFFQNNYALLFSLKPNAYYKNLPTTNGTRSWMKFTPTDNINDTQACYSFEFKEPSDVSYGTVDMWYSSNCYLDNPVSNVPHFSSLYDNGNSVKTGDYVITLINFDLYNITTNETTNKNENDNIVVPEDTVKIEQLETTKGIWGTVKGIFEAIVSLPKKIIDGITSLFQWLLNGIIDALKMLFIPSDDYLKNWFDNMQKSVEKQLGFLSYPITWILNILNKFLTLNDTGHYVISWNAIKVPNFDKNIIESGSFDLAILLEDSTIRTFHSLYITVVNALMLLAFMNLCMNTYNRVFGGDIDTYEYLTVDEGYSINADGTTTHSRITTRRKL